MNEDNKSEWIASEYYDASTLDTGSIKIEVRHRTILKNYYEILCREPYIHDSGMYINIDEAKKSAVEKVRERLTEMLGELNGL